MTIQEINELARDGLFPAPLAQRFVDHHWDRGLKLTPTMKDNNRALRTEAEQVFYSCLRQALSQTNN